MNHIKSVISKVDIPKSMILIWGFPLLYFITIILILDFKGYGLFDIYYLVHSGKIRTVPPIIFSISMIVWVAISFRLTLRWLRSDWNILWVQDNYLYDYRGVVSSINDINIESISYIGALKTGIIIRPVNAPQRIYPRFLMKPGDLALLKDSIRKAL